MDTKNAVLTNLSKILRKEAEIFLLNVRERKKKNASKVWFASEYSFGLLEDNFYNSTVFFSTNRQKFVTQYPKKIRIFSRKNSFASKCSHGHEKNAVSTDFSEISPKNLKFFLLNIRKWKTVFFSKKFASEFSYGRKESCFDHPTETFLTKSRHFFVHCPLVLK